jgi:hypothetical protein
MTAARVFLDTSVVKHSFRKRKILRRKISGIERSGNAHSVELFEIVVVDPADKVTNAELQQEIDLISHIADLARAKTVELLWHHEAWVEFSSIWMVSSGGKPELLEAGVTWVDSPVKYSRTLNPARFFSGKTWKDVQVEFLATLRYPRYLEIKQSFLKTHGSTSRRYSS